jgi:eukaryotic-like serine/threonine-protein kinase
MDLESIGRYRILEKLGSGGMGEVYLAEDTQLGRKVALKLLAEELTQNRDRLNRFDQEAYAASALNHPNILTIYEMGDEAGRHFIATEFVDGETLRHRLGGPPMDLSEVLNVGIQIAGALEEAHAAGIIHRDIKPENVMIRRSGHVKVLDFGLAKLVEKASEDADTEAVTRALVQTDAGMVLGTSQYMSPEQARGKPVDARTDIWSLGVVLYEMATGRPPFHGETKTDVIVAIARNDPPPIARFAPNAPAEFEWIVLKALRKDVDERYQTIKELESDLKKLKQRFEFETELERSMGPQRYSSAFAGIADTEIHGSTMPPSTQTGANPALSTSVAPLSAQTRASSAEYVVGEIKRHKMGIVVVTLVALIAAAAIVYFAFLRKTNVLTEKDTILLTDFTNTTGDVVFDETLKQALAVQLAQSPFLNIFSEDRVRDTLTRMNMPTDTRITREIGKDICARQSIKAMLLGSISQVGSHYVVLLDAVNSQTGDMIASEQFEVDGKEQVLRSLGPAASSLREKLGESLASLKSFDAPIENVTTSSLEALRQYSLGTLAHSKADYEHAIPFYQAAIQRDPNFAIAHARLASCYNNIRQNEAARSEFIKAYELRDRVSERERFIITSNYYGGATGQWDEQIKELEKWKATYPHDFEPLNLLSNRYTTVGPFEPAVLEGNKAIELNQNDARPYVNVGVAFIELNRFEEAKNVLMKAQQLGRETTNMHARLYQLGFLVGDGALMKDQVEWAKANRNAETALIWQAQVAAFQGQLNQADQLTDRAIQMLRRPETKEAISQWMLAEATRDAAFGNCGRASQLTKQALDLSREQANLMSAANAYARCAQSPQAQALVDELAKTFPLDTLLSATTLPIIRAQTELTKGNAAQAIQLLETTRRYEAYGEFWPQYLRGEAYLKLNNGGQAVTEFKTILAHRGWYPMSPLYPLSQLGLARAEAAIGDKGAARTAYQDLFALWKDADANLPALVAARAEYDKLK